MNINPVAHLSRSLVLEVDARYCARYGLLDRCAIDAAASARRRGWMQLDEFIAVATWKLASSGSVAFEQATPEEIERHTRAAFSHADDDLNALAYLDSIRGIGFRGATAFMHVTFNERYPMLDQRVLRFLGLADAGTLVNSDDALRNLWPDFAGFCRAESARLNVSLRELDRAMWWLDPARSPI